MTATAYHRAIERRNALVEEMSAMRSKLADMAGEVSRLEMFISMFQELAPEVADGSVDDIKRGEADLPRWEFVGDRFNKRQSRAELGPLITGLILETGRPMNRSEIRDGLEAKGIPVTGKDPLNKLGTILYRMRATLKSIPGRGYWPIHADLPQETTPVDKKLEEKHLFG